LEKKLFAVAQVAALNSSSGHPLTCVTVMKPRELAEAVKKSAEAILKQRA
jgi:hypothetical protein